MARFDNPATTLRHDDRSRFSGKSVVQLSAQCRFDDANRFCVGLSVPPFDSSEQFLSARVFAFQIAVCAVRKFLRQSLAQQLNKELVINKAIEANTKFKIKGNEMKTQIKNLIAATLVTFAVGSAGR